MLSAALLKAKQSHHGLHGPEDGGIMLLGNELPVYLD